ncbi:MAG: phosphoribosyltransferase [Candidatus Nanohaloarchaea archaeon]
MVFQDREEAGKKLGKELVARDLEADIVLAIPRGGLPLGREVADALDTELDVIVASKIGSPGNPELAIGAAASDGSYWLNEELIDRMGVDQEFIDEAIEKEAENAREKLEFMRGEEELPEMGGKQVVVVDDGVATGSTAIACLRHIRDAGAEKVVLAVPVGPRDTRERLADEADEIVVLETPKAFGAVGRHYRDFEQVTDEAAREYLET